MGTASLIRTWLWLSARIASMLPTTHSLTNAQRSAVQVTPSSVGYNGLMVLKKTMTRVIQAAMRAQMTVVTILTSLCGEKQLQASLKASAPHLNAQNAA